MFSFLSTLDVSLEGVELVGPKRLYLVEPHLEVDERLWEQPVHAQARVVFDLLLFYPDLDEAAGPQYPQMPAHGRPAQRASGRQLTGPARTFSKQFHHLAPGGVGQSSERGVKISNHCFRFK